MPGNKMQGKFIPEMTMNIIATVSIGKAVKMANGRVIRENPPIAIVEKA